MKIKAKFARAGTPLKDSTAKLEELLGKLPGKWPFIFYIHYINTTMTTCILYDYCIYLFVFMYLPELGCDGDIIQEWQKEEVEALIPRELGSSALSLHEKEKHCFLFSLVSYLYVAGLILQWDESYASLLLMSKKLRYQYMVCGSTT